MALGLAMIGGLAIALFLLARSAIWVSDKAKTSALADASAKSVATWYAQVLNYDAYTNRAIAANEIMMAQAVTMTAWTQHAHNLTRNTSKIAAVFPSLRPVAQWLQEISWATHQLASTGATIEVPLRSAYTRALQASQEIMHASATPFAAQSMVNEVIWTADRRFFGQLIPSSDISAFYGLTKTLKGAERRHLATMLHAQQDSFSLNRGYNQRLYLVPTTRCIPTSGDKVFSRLARRGGTWMSSDMEDWESADTLSIHSWKKRSKWNFTCGSASESTALAWGAADASLRGSDGLMTNQAGLSQNGSAFRQARTGVKGLSGYLGLSSHRELAKGALEARKTTSVRVPVLVRLPLSSLHKVTAGRLTEANQTSTGVGNAIWSLAVAETYFLRPLDPSMSTSDREFANLFSPFWHARLVLPTDTDEAISLAVASARGSQ